MKLSKTVFTLSLAIIMVVSFSVSVFSFSRDELGKYKEKTLIAPDFTAQSTEGKTYKLSDYRGKGIIVLETGSST